MLTPHGRACICDSLPARRPFVAATAHDAGLALAIYANAMNRCDGEPERLAALVGRPHRMTTGNGSAQGVEEGTVAGSIPA
jgi:hypothetical protein